MVVVIGLLVWAGVGIVNRAVDDVLDGDPVAAASESASVDQNRELAAELNTTISAIPGVVQAGTTYYSDIGVSPQIAVEVIVESDGDVDRVVQEALETVWLSNVDPLYVIGIRPTVSGAANAGEEQTWQLRFGDTAAELEEEFGPRPG